MWIQGLMSHFWTSPIIFLTSFSKLSDIYGHHWKNILLLNSWVKWKINMIFKMIICVLVIYLRYKTWTYQHSSLWFEAVTSSMFFKESWEMVCLNCHCTSSIFCFTCWRLASKVDISTHLCVIIHAFLVYVFWIINGTIYSEHYF